jgi:hypothetical protein
MTEDEIKKNKRKVFSGLFGFIVLFILLCTWCTKATTKKPQKVQEKQVTQTQKEKELSPGNYPDFIYYDNATYKIIGKFQRDDFVFGVTQVPFYDYFTDEDFLKTAKMVDESDYGYVEIRFSDKKTSLILQKGIAQISSLYGVTAEQGGINKGLLWFTVENGKVLRLNEEQVKKYDSQ